MGNEFKIYNTKTINFPNRCILCMRKSPIAEYKIYRRFLIRRVFSFFHSKKYKKIELKLTLCLKHYRLFMLKRILSVISFISFVIFAAPIVLYSLDLIVVSINLTDKCYVFSCFSIMIFILTLLFPPLVRIKKISEDNIIISLRNDEEEYANEFLSKI